MFSKFNFKFCSERKDNWEHEIKDAILEKCANCTNILSINVEKSSGEVRKNVVYFVDYYFWIDCLVSDLPHT